jgi:hypothetical protein
MVRREALFRVLAGMMLVTGWLGGDMLKAGEEAKPPQPPAVEKAPPKEAEAVKPEDLQAALRGFRGFLIGEVVGKNDAGATLRIKALTLIEGCRAANPSLALGQDVPVKYATDKDEQGKERPVPSLADAMRRIEKMPAIALGGFGGGNATIIMGVGQDNQAAVGPAVRTMTRAMTIQVNGQEIRVGGDDGPAEKGEKPKGPLVTARVLTDAEGTLVMDRVMPGAHAAATWDAMPLLRFADAKPPELPVPPKKEEKKDTDF